MIFAKTAIEGVWRIALDPNVDERGFFARAFCSDEFAAHGLPHLFEQSSLSRNRYRGTLRGIHYQAPPHAEAKIVRCTRGSVYDVALDIRDGSATYGHWVAETLSADNGLALYIDAGVAHGFLTLEDNSDVLYQITPAFRPGLGSGIRWNDPRFNIDWPITSPTLSDRDAAYPDYGQ